MNHLNEAAELEKMAGHIQRDADQLAGKALGGGTTMSMVTAVMIFNQLNFDVKKRNWPGRDRLFFSREVGWWWLAGLVRAGLVNQANVDQTSRRLAGREITGVEWFEDLPGSALAAAVGCAWAGYRQEAKWLTFVCSTAEHLIKYGSQSISLAGQLNLAKLTALILMAEENDDEIDRTREKIELENWHTITIDGNRADEIKSSCAEARLIERPVGIFIRIGKK